MTQDFASRMLDDQETQCYICNLPDEILSTIFLFNALQRSYGQTGTCDAYSTMLSTILVCKRWHMVGRSCPDLWGQLIDYERHPPSWIKELLTRSKSTPLDVGEDSVFRKVQLLNSETLPVLGHIFEQSSRIRTLSLQIRIKPWNYICTNFLPSPAPMLEYLNLITACPFPDCLYAGPLFSNHAPKLRRVHLQRCLIDFSSPVLSNLTELSVMGILGPRKLALRRVDHPLKTAPTVAGWLNIIKNIPSLVYLTLNNAISPSPDHEPTPIAELPHLSFLTIGAHRSQEGTALLRHLSIPDACSIRLRFDCRDSSPASDRTVLLAFLRNQVTQWPEDAADRYLQAKILSGNRIHFGNTKHAGYVWDMTERAVIEEHSAVARDPLVWLALSLDTPEDAVELFNQLLSLYAPTYPTTTTLDLWTDEEFTDILPPSNVANILHSFTTLQTLNLLEQSPLHLLPLLQSTSLPDRPILPALSALHLTRTSFEEQQRAVYVAVSDFLAYRLQNLSPLSNLHMVDSNISEENIRSLVRVGDVEISFATLMLDRLT